MIGPEAIEIFTLVSHVLPIPCLVKRFPREAKHRWRLVKDIILADAGQVQHSRDKHMIFKHDPPILYWLGTSASMIIALSDEQITLPKPVVQNTSKTNKHPSPLNLSVAHVILVGKDMAKDVLRETKYQQGLGHALADVSILIGAC